MASPTRLINPIAWPYRTWTKAKLSVKLLLQHRTVERERESELLLMRILAPFGVCCKRMPKVEPAQVRQDISEPKRWDLAWDVGPAPAQP